MKISDKIYIDLEREQLSGEVFPLLTYKNPDYYQKMNMGLSVRGVPLTVKTYTLEGNNVTILRGEALRVKEYIKDFEYNFEHSDHPISLQYINNDFELDEYQQGAIEAIKGKKQGIIHAVTSAGKSVMILKAITEIRQRALIVVPRKLLMKQLLEDIDKYIRDEKGNKIDPGVIGNGKFTIGDITIGIDKSVHKHLSELREQFGVVVLDECHICPAKTISDLINALNSRYRFGFSGTLRRKDQKEFLMFATFGQVIFTISKDVLLAKGRIVPVSVRVLESDTQFDWDGVVQGLTDRGRRNPTQEARVLQEKTIANDPVRQAMILKHVSTLQGKVLVMSRYVEPCYALHDALLEEYGIESGVITGTDSKRAEKAYTDMKEKDLQVIFATIGCVSTGVSISDLAHGVLISPVYTNELLLHQIRGRFFRASPGKTHATLWFVFDQYIFPVWKLSKFLSIMRN
jgi:superfamily II DNA or RNA helicase